ncbi:MAG: hypothetical protein JO042_16595 [Sinobacteraceae bacterium]|nr:hypothetical protein [Nevskiaceae bacterium]
MRKVALTLALTAAGAAGAWADGVVYLDDPAALEQLRTSNPTHYARAEKILAAANHLCRPKPGEVEYVKGDAKDVSCSASLLRTSNPPKRQIRFRLDDTQYIALVVVTDDPPRLVAADAQR